MTTAGANAPVFEVRGLRKRYGGLRPLRLQSFVVPAGGIVALMGLDAPAAEIFVNLLTGATLPDEGEVLMFGRPTADITDGDEWLQTLDRFGILGARAVLLEELTVAQNLAMTLTLEIDPIAASTRAQVESLARDVSIDAALLDRKVATLEAAGKLRVRLGRAVALGASVLLMEHPTASLPPNEVGGFAEVVARLAAARGLTVVAVTADAAFAPAITRTVWKLVPATGTLVPVDTGGAWTRVKRLFGQD